MREVPGVVAPPPLIFAGAFAAAAGAKHFVPLPSLPASPSRVLGAAIVVAGLAWGGAAVATMRGAKTNINPYKPTNAVVESGPFRYSRNPIYVAMALTYIGGSLLMRSAVPLLLLPGVLAVIDRGVIEREEAYLEDKFGDRYLAYKMRVRRWV
jgi:protein-S-isoprenylcysteine O-methyltransferase Ste14